MQESLKSARSIRTFVGAEDFQTSRSFYSELGFEESTIDEKMSFFKVNSSLGFYLQDYYVKEWCDNSMVLLEVQDVNDIRKSLIELEIERKYKNVNLLDIRRNEHGKQIFVYDLSGVLWHFFEFSQKS
jgi:hypothetical protein